MLDEYDIDAPDDPPPEESDNRTFLMVAGGLGGFALISIICLAAVFLLRGDDTETVEADATADARSTEIAMAEEQTATAEAQIPTNTPTLLATTPAGPSATSTSVIVATTAVPEGGPTLHPATATVQALLTQAAIAQTQAAQDILTVTPTATIVLPDTGFADDVGIFGMVSLAAALILLIFFVRYLRVANA